jgi:hypothetical protein
MTVVQWLSPSPLWNDFAAVESRPAFRRPAILRFATDTFMEDLQTLLSTKSATLRNYVAQPESWQAPAVGLPAAGVIPQASALPLKFFQPVHQRFYLATAALTCRVAGLPDHTVKKNQNESVGFVIRRVVAKATNGDVTDPAKRDEFAFVAGPTNAWSSATGTALVDGEEQHALFPMNFGTNGSKRRLFAGLIPVSNRQAYATARSASSQSSSGGSGGTTISDTDPRLIDFQRRVLDPWTDLRDWYDHKLSSADESQQATIDSADHGSALILLDFANFFHDQLTDVWNAIVAQSRPAAGPNRDLYDKLGGATLVREDGGSAVTLPQALLNAKAAENALESATLTNPPTLPNGYVRVSLTNGDSASRTLVDRDGQGYRPLVGYIAAALAALPAPASASSGTTKESPRLPATAPASPNNSDWFVIRCVYSRPQCGPAHPVISEPSEPFQLASFFDPDAPARSLQVALPIDTTPAALRRYDKGVGFLISDELSKQMNRVTGLKKIMDGELGDEGLGIGMICSLSIPIITICAFIVLMIFLMLLNLIFWWLPFFKICFPVPGLKAKGA